MKCKLFAAGLVFAVILFSLVFSSLAFSQAPQISLPLVPSTVTPGSVPATSSGLTITVNGTGFNSGSIVNWNGSPRPTTFVSSIRLRVLIAAEDVESTGTAWVTVRNTSLTSNVVYFEITNPANPVSFTTSSYAAYNGPRSVAVGDFNGDGKQDLVAANYGGGNYVSVFLGNGDGTFQASANYFAGPSPYEVEVGDFNGDGKLDLAVADAGNSVSVLLGNGDGTFQAPVIYATGYLSTSVAVGDFNGDGKLDLAVVNLNSGNLSVLLGNGDGTFQPAVNYAAGPFPFKVAAGDFNGDGNLDLAVTNQGQTSVNVLLGNGDGTFQAPVNHATGNNPQSITAADFNGDGKLDLAVGNWSDDTVSVLLGNGDGTFGAPVNYATGASPYSVAVADFNGDGKPDLAVANFGGNSVSMLLGNGDGTFQPAVNYAGGTNPTGVAVGDFNADGRMDLAMADFASNDVAVLLQPTPDSGDAQLTGGNSFSGNQTISGDVAATLFSGNGSGLTGVTASGLNCAGCVGNSQLGIVYAAGDAQGGNAMNALALGGFPASAFAPATGSPYYAPATGSGAYVAKAGDTMTGTLNLAADGLTVGGNQLVFSSGNIGVGTTTPEILPGYRSLHVDSSVSGFGGAFLELTHSTTGQKGRVVMDDNGFLLNAVNSAPVKIKSSNFNGGNDPGQIYVSTGGNVGIRTGSPAATLDVNGTANFSGLVTFAQGQTFPGAGNGTITGVTAGNGLSGGGTTGNVSLTNSGILSLSGGTGINVSAGQTPTLSLNTGFTDGRYARLGTANIFTANQTVPNLTVSGTVTSSSGNFSANSNNPILSLTQSGNGSGLTASATNTGGAAISGTGGYFGLYGYGVEAGVKGESTLNFGVVGTSASNAAVYGIGGPYGVVGQGNTAGIWAQAGNATATGLLASTTSSTGTAGTFNVTAGAKLLSGQTNNSEVFSVASDGSMTTSGKLTTAGSVTIGSGTPILKHFSVLFANVALNLKLSPTTCTTWSGAFSPATDGDTVAVGMGSSLMSANIVYSAWATNGSVTVRICNPTGSPTNVGSGNIRVDVWKH